jgi:hypothetical protein
VTRIGEVGTTVFLLRLHRLIVTANVVPSSPILAILMMEALSSSHSSILTRAAGRNMAEADILVTATDYGLDYLVVGI